MSGVARLALVAVSLFLLYIHGLDRTGLLGPDEPRYASIGREMARSGDWITPRLWGAPWFEKPVLSYWMTGAGFRLGLGEELAPRLPVALIGALFLIAYWALLREEFGEPAALFSAVILGTSAGWLAYSHVAVMDVPVTAFYSLAMLCALEWLRTGRTRRLPVAGALLGLAVLAKGLPPLILSAPLVWFGRKRLADLWRVAAGALAVALPWYAACFAANGRVFFDDFIWKHHFVRFFSPALEHVQPVWYYVPVLLAGLYPWIPLAGLVRRPSSAAERFLWAWLVFGFALWSASVNKLPGYVLTVLPALTALVGIALAGARRARWWLAACSLLLALSPAIAAVLPAALERGIRRAGLAAPPVAYAVAAAGLAAAVWMLETRRREAAVALLAGAVTLGVWVFTEWTFPELDRALSARARLGRIRPDAAEACYDDARRDLRYGLNYYAGTALPDCKEIPKRVRIQ